MAPLTVAPLTMASLNMAPPTVAPLTMAPPTVWLHYYDSILTMAGGQGAALRRSAQGARGGESHEDSTVTTLTRAMLTMATLTMATLTMVILAIPRRATRG